MCKRRVHIAGRIGAVAVTLGLIGAVVAQPASATAITCTATAGAPYKNGALTASAITRITCSQAVSHIRVEGFLYGPGGARASRTTYCYGTTSCSLRVDMPLVTGTYYSWVDGEGYTPASGARYASNVSRDVFLVR